MSTVLIDHPQTPLSIEELLRRIANELTDINSILKQMNRHDYETRAAYERPAEWECET